MIIFKMVADTYRRLVRKGELTEEQAKKDIRIYDFLAECDQEDLYKLIDSSAFNDIIKAIVSFFKLDEGGKYSAKKRSYIQKRRIAGSYVRFQARNKAC